MTEPPLSWGLLRMAREATVSSLEPALSLLQARTACFRHARCPLAQASPEPLLQSIPVELLLMRLLTCRQVSGKASLKKA